MAKAKPNLPNVASKIYALLRPLDSADRHNVIQSAVALFGESFISAEAGHKKNPDDGPAADSAVPIGTKAKRWTAHNGITDEDLQEIFHFQNGNVEVIASDVPGNSNRTKSRNCYLLTGIQALLRSDEPTFQDKDAVALCEHMNCYDKANNADIRKKIGLSGLKQAGFTLTAPCLREAATLVKETVAPSQ